MREKRTAFGKGLFISCVLMAFFIFLGGWNPVASAAPEGELKIAMTTLGSETMDPVLSNNDAKPMTTPFYDTIIGVGPDGKLSKNTGVARDWKLAPDSMSLTINVRPGIKFHNGDDLTAADVKFTMEQFSSSRCITSEVGTLRKIIKSIETPDPLTVVVNYKIPNAVLPNFLSRQMGIEGSVLPKKYFEAKGAQY